MSLKKIYISYRRQDSAGWSGRLFDVLASRYGTERIFLDIATIPPGVDFVSHTESAVSRSSVVLVVIGPQWLTAAYREGNLRRIDDPDDLVRNELRTAIKLQKLLVPVLVGGASMPTVEMLPADIASLATYGSVSLADASWNRDIATLTALLDRDATSHWTRWRPWKRR
jgi:hypothetical protein